MRRYSPSYFISTAVKSLWRNGFMTVASISILLSCLVVMGCFALLVQNIDYNLENIDGLNQIVAFVDVDNVIEERKALEEESQSDGEGDQTEPSETEAETEKTAPAEDGLIIPEIEPKADGGEAYEINENAVDSLFLNFETQLEAFAGFTDLVAAKRSVASVKNSFDILGEKLNALDYKTDEIIDRYEKDKAAYEYSCDRIDILFDIEHQIKSTAGIDPLMVEFTSKSAALIEQKAKYSDYVNLYEVLNEDDNPFPDSFTITYTDIDGIELIRWDLEHIDGVYSVVCRSELAQNIETLKGGVVMIFTWFLIILFLVSLFVISNTIKIAVHTRREEIGVMRFVGATNFFITTPFVIEGGLIGLISGGLGYLIVKNVYEVIANKIGDMYQIVSLINPVSVNAYLGIGFFGVGILTGILASAISIRKYLKA